MLALTSQPYLIVLFGSLVTDTTHLLSCAFQHFQHFFRIPPHGLHLLYFEGAGLTTHRFVSLHHLPLYKPQAQQEFVYSAELMKKQYNMAYDSTRTDLAQEI